MYWQEITALCAGFGVMGAIFMFATKAIVRTEISKLNGTYLRSDVAKEKFRQIDDHFDYLAKKHGL